MPWFSRYVKYAQSFKTLLFFKLFLQRKPTGSEAFENLIFCDMKVNFLMKPIAITVSCNEQYSFTNLCRTNSIENQ